METNEQLFDKYLDKYNELKQRNELHKLKYSPSEFLEEVERIRKSITEQWDTCILGPNWVIETEKKALILLFSNKVTYEDMKTHANKSQKRSEKTFLKQAPKIKAEIKKLKVPLDFFDIQLIFRALLRKQVSLSYLSTEVLNDFMKTEQFEVYIKKKLENSDKS